MDTEIDRCVAQLHAFVVVNGGRLQPQMLAKFYDLHPHARALLRPTPRVFIETHGRRRLAHRVVWHYERLSNRSTIVTEQRETVQATVDRPRAQEAVTQRPPPSPQEPILDKSAVVRKFHAFVLARGGRLAASAMQDFYQTMPAARIVMKPTVKSFINAFGDQTAGVRLTWEVVDHLASIVASSNLVPTATRDTQQHARAQPNAPTWRQCLELLDHFVKRHKQGRATMSDLGAFCKENASVASILRPTKSIRSCQTFIDQYGQRDGYSLTWQGDPPVVVRGSPTSNHQVKRQVIQITSVADATAVVQRKLQLANVIAVDLEGDLTPNGRMSLLQIAVCSKVVYVFDVLKCPAMLHSASVGLGAILASPTVVKVVHDGRHDAQALLGQFGITMAHVFDTQVAYCRLHETKQLVGLNTVLQQFTDHQNTKKNSVQHRPGLWEQRPLPPNLLDYAAQDVQFSIQAFDKMAAKMSAKDLRRCMQASIDRMAGAALPAGKTNPTKPAQKERLSTLVRKHEPAFRHGKDGIEVVDEDPDAFRIPIEENVTVRKLYTIKNHGSGAARLLRVALLASSAALPFHLPNQLVFPRTLEAGQQVEIAVHFCSPQPGSFRAVLTFKLSTAEGNMIDVVRILDNVNCVSVKTTDALRAMIQNAATSSRYTRRTERARPGHVVDAFVQEGFAHDLVIRIAEYKMPKILATTTTGAPLLEQTYIRHFQQMLWLEERQQHIGQQDFDMVGAILQPAGRTHRLAVPGLAENRPSVLCGDKVFLVHKGKTFQARAVDITRDEVVLGTPGSFAHAYQRSDRVDVRFCLSRVPMRLCHQGIVAFDASIHRKFLFPSIPTSTIATASDRHEFRYTRELNPEQMKAVSDLQSFATLSAPYVIYGPPGTGKTVTLVEAITQIVRANRSTRILMCTPTNAAADLLVDRLANVIPKAPHGRMLRILGFMRKEKDVLASVLPFTLRNGNGGFHVPTLDDLTKPSLQIVVATLGTGAKLYNYGIERGHFQIVAIDEAGQATEPDIMSVLGPLALPTTALILAGDPQQLGPVIKSTAAANGGLGISLLERLVSRPLYQDATTIHGQRVMTKLRRNYRAHPVLLTVPNTLFYEGSLLSCASAATCRAFENWEMLSTQGVPLLFHGVQGHDCQDPDSPSWFNPQEIALVHAYVDMLLTNGAGVARRVQPSDIGIITPYAKQRKKIHEVLQASGIQGVRVGSVEQFQGAELPVIIVSTVRSSRDFFDEDAKFNLGFLANAKRFNVAITRAQSLLIVVGNPFVLEADPNWDVLLRHCRVHGAWKGARTRATVDEGAEATAATATRADVIHPSSFERSTFALM